MAQLDSLQIMLIANRLELMFVSIQLDAMLIKI